jgi:hypothetical protein
MQWIELLHSIVIARFLCGRASFPADTKLGCPDKPANDELGD